MDPRGRDGRPLRAQPHLRRPDDPRASPDHRPAPRRAPHGGDPERYIAEYADAGAAVFTFHPEATVHVQRHLAAVREHGMLAGLALNPATPLAVAEEVVDDLDLVLVMSVNPGYGGQSYLPAATDKIRRVPGAARPAPAPAPRSRWTAASRRTPSPRRGAPAPTPSSPAPPCSARPIRPRRCATSSGAAPSSPEAVRCRSNGP